MIACLPKYRKHGVCNATVAAPTFCAEFLKHIGTALGSGLTYFFFFFFKQHGVCAGRWVTVKHAIDFLKSVIYPSYIKTHAHAHIRLTFL